MPYGIELEERLDIRVVPSPLRPGRKGIRPWMMAFTGAIGRMDRFRPEFGLAFQRR
jgi:hypothetical protein